LTYEETRKMLKESRPPFCHPAPFLCALEYSLDVPIKILQQKKTRKLNCGSTIPRLTVKKDNFFISVDVWCGAEEAKRKKQLAFSSQKT